MMKMGCKVAHAAPETGQQLGPSPRKQSCAAGYEGKETSQRSKEQRGHKQNTLIISETEFSK
jgi:hypothetical protein